MTNKIKLIIVDDHEIFRNGLKMVLNRLKYIDIVGEAENGSEFLQMLDADNLPDIVLMDIEMPQMNGIDATRLALEKYPDLRIIALTMFNEDEYIQNMIDLGVKGFLIKNINKETLDRAIQTVNNGGSFYSEELFSFFTRQLSKETPKKSDVPELTRREKETLQLICEGLSNSEIAEALYISERTVIGHKSNLLAKSGCKNTLSLVSFAIKNRMVVI
jgi:DNA-binding NarL/FixJ family response regulator